VPIGTGGSPKFCSPLEYAVFFNLSESFFVTAYVPLTPESPLKPSESSRIPKAVLSAQAQFKQWYASFRERAARTLNIRFFVGTRWPFATPGNTTNVLVSFRQTCTEICIVQTPLCLTLLLSFLYLMHTAMPAYVGLWADYKRDKRDFSTAPPELLQQVRP
jgi:hypothetical protein